MAEEVAQRTHSPKTNRGGGVMLPVMRSKNSMSKYAITAFGGINTGFSQAVNELTQSKNMSSELFPAISTAKGFESMQTFENTICTASFFDKLYTVERTNADSGDIYLRCGDMEKNISSFESPEEIPQNHTIEFLKDSALVIPENVIYHIKEDKLQSGDVSITTTKANCQERFEEQSGRDEEMPMPYNVWYSAELSHNAITAMNKTYYVSSTAYKFYHFSLTSQFEIGDVVTLKMSVKPIDVAQDSAYHAYVDKMANGISLKIKDITKTRHSTPTGTVSEITELIFDDYSIDLGGYDDVVVMTVTVEKSIPKFVDICSFENRMWGVTEKELRTSKLGDASEWNDFSVDEYGTLPSSCFCTEVESDGSFTAVTSYNGNILAFKEDCIYKVYGNEPNEYSLTRINCAGVKKGAHRTVTTVNGSLYYMARGGIYCFNGSSVRCISTNMDISALTAVSASGNERFYVINLKSGSDSFLYVYDTFKGVWHITDCPQNIREIILGESEILFVCENEIFKKSERYCDTWNFALSFAKKEFASKHMCAVLMRYYLEDGASFTVTLKNKHASYTLAQVSQSAENKPLFIDIPVSCSEDADLIFEGKGKFILTSLTVKYKETGIKN